MIEYLESLLEQREDRKALDYAEQLLRSRENTPEDLLRIYSVLLLARHNVGDYQAAVEAGEMARQLAKEIGDWDAYGEACINVSATYGKLNIQDQALSALYDYLGSLQRYTGVAKYELLALQNIGRAHIEAGRYAEARDVFARMRNAASRLRNPRLEIVALLSLIECNLRLGQFQDVPRLMAQCAHHFRSSGADLRSDDGPLVLTRYRASYALLTGRLLRATLVALRGNALANGLSRHQYEFQKVLSHVAVKRGEVDLAIGHGLAARAYATVSNRQDLVIEANQFLYGVSKQSERPD